MIYIANQLFHIGKTRKPIAIRGTYYMQISDVAHQICAMRAGVDDFGLLLIKIPYKHKFKFLVRISNQQVQRI